MADTPLSLTTSMGVFYENTFPSIRDFITLFFPNTITTTQEQIQVDRYITDIKNIGYVPLHGSSTLLTADAGNGIMYTPPRLSIKTPVNEDIGSVTAGLSPNSTTEQHLLLKYSRIQQQHSKTIMATVVLQALEMMRTGAFTATTEGGQAVGTFSYGRDSSLNLSTYDTSVSGAFNSLKALFEALKPFYISRGNLVALVGSNLMDAIEQDSEFKDAMKNTTYQLVREIQAGDPLAGNRVLTRNCTVKIPSTSHYITLISFDQVYVNSAGTTLPMFPLNEMVMTSLDSDRYAAYGGITVADTSTNSLNVVEGEMVTDRLLTKEPDALSLRSQSRPLMIPGNINHIGRLIATDLSAT